MFACGKAGLPESISVNGLGYNMDVLFKHDFFACTGRYVCPETGEKIVLKISRLQPFFWIPLRWLGCYLRNREFRILSLLQDLQQIPQILCKFGKNGLVYRYIEGQSLDEKPAVPDHFFDELETLLKTVHSKGVCYMDLNKRGNILIRMDRQPCLIDFQISLHLPKWLGFLAKSLQKEDMYHFYKHKRRFRPDLMTVEENLHSGKVSFLIKAHRFVSKPFRNIRRWFLRKLYQLNILVRPEGERSPENDPSRFLQSE
jgi:serine/threonine protein kinase